METLYFEKLHVYRKLNFSILIFWTFQIIILLSIRYSLHSNYTDKNIW